MSGNVPLGPTHIRQVYILIHQHFGSQWDQIATLYFLRNQKNILFQQEITQSQVLKHLLTTLFSSCQLDELVKASAIVAQGFRIKLG